jgi:predicted metal-dependent RNase
VVHGEENVCLEFEKVVQEKLGFETYVPHKGEELDI